MVLAEIVPELPSHSMLDITVDELSSSTNSHNSSLGKLLDHDSTTYWQSSGSRPHSITVSFSHPRHVKNVFLRMHGSDGNFMPEQVSVIQYFRDREEESEIIETRKDNKWHLFPCVSKNPCSKITMKLHRQHGGGRDCRVRGLAIEIIGEQIYSTEKIHRKLLLKDLIRLATGAFAQSTSPSLIGLQTDSDKDSSHIPDTDCTVHLMEKDVPAHSCLLEARISNFDQFWNSETRTLDLSFIQPQDLALGIIQYVYSSSAEVILNILRSSIFKEKEPKDHSSLTLDDSIVHVRHLLEFGNRLGIEGLKELCYSFIAKHLTPSTISTKTLKFVIGSKSEYLREVLFSFLIQLDWQAVSSLMSSMPDDFVRALVKSDLVAKKESEIPQKDSKAAADSEKEDIAGVVIAKCDKFEEGMKVHYILEGLTDATLFYGVGTVLSVDKDDLIVDFVDEKNVRVPKMMMGKVEEDLIVDYGL
ncbi:hypothetical protein ADUPG1_013703 [Aduncisulcus paluster]|uniref:DOC domain-containing protein n=1 Tax=Aduncisulcus paluster TaxID=2918883 RepID=A0ABQ5K7U4_9EUKA|nr:hypothetical protein ADUPG1_013703 [Aduncisulcus paluster]